MLDKDSGTCSNVEHAIGWFELGHLHDSLEPRDYLPRRRFTKTMHLVAKERSLVLVMRLPIVHMLLG